MAPEYGATCGFFPIDAETLDYLQDTGAQTARIALVEKYAKAQGLLSHAGEPRSGLHRHAGARPDDGRAVAGRPDAAAGPRRARPTPRHGFAGRADQRLQEGRERRQARHGRRHEFRLGHGDVVIAAITSCTNTSNPSVMIGAGLVAQKAVAQGPEGQALGEDLAGAGHPGGAPIISTRPGWTSRSTSSASTWSAMAAPPASAIPARCPNLGERSPSTIWSPPRCSRATAISKAASIPRCAPTIWPRRCWWWPMRWPVRSTSI